MTLRFVFDNYQGKLDPEIIFSQIKEIYVRQTYCIREIVVLAVNLGLLPADVISRPQLHVRLVKSLYTKYTKTFDEKESSKLVSLSNEAIRTLGYSLSYIVGYYPLDWSKYETYEQFTQEHPGMLMIVPNQEHIELWFEGSMHDPYMERMLFALTHKL